MAAAVACSSHPAPKPAATAQRFRFVDAVVAYPLGTRYVHMTLEGDELRFDERSSASVTLTLPAEVSSALHREVGRLNPRTLLPSFQRYGGDDSSLMDLGLQLEPGGPLLRFGGDGPELTRLRRIVEGLSEMLANCVVRHSDPNACRDLDELGFSLEGMPPEPEADATLNVQLQTDSAQAGDTLAVVTNCPAVGHAAVKVAARESKESKAVPPAGFGESTPWGSPVTALHLPATLPAGRYDVTLWCLYAGGADRFSAKPATLTVR